MDKLVARTTVTPAIAGVFPVDAPLLSVRELALTGILRIQGRGNDARLITAMEHATGLRVPVSEAWSESGGRRLARIGPNEWLLFTEIDDETAALDALTTHFAGLFATATLISDSRVAFAVSRAASADLMAKGTSLDLHPAAFPTGIMRSTRFAGLPATIARIAPETFVVYLDVSLSQFALHWLMDAAEEFRTPVQPCTT